MPTERPPGLIAVGLKGAVLLLTDAAFAAAVRQCGW